MKRFKEDPACRLFLATDAGGVGLNLQNASIVINCDLPWNPAKLEQRIARALLRLTAQSGERTEQGGIDLTFSRQDLAEMTGTTLYTVSRSLSAWEKQGIISTGRERVTVLDPHGLVRIADDLKRNGSYIPGIRPGQRTADYIEGRYG